MAFLHTVSDRIPEKWQIVLNVEGIINKQDHDGYCSDPGENKTSTCSISKTFYPESEHKVADYLSSPSTTADDEGNITSSWSIIEKLVESEYPHSGSGYCSCKTTVTLNRVYITRIRIENLLDKFRTTKCGQDATHRREKCEEAIRKAKEVIQCPKCRTRHDSTAAGQKLCRQHQKVNERNYAGRPRRTAGVDYRAQIPCRNLQNQGGCPFGDRCYYKH
jgi:hypothetical protein